MHRTIETMQVQAVEFDAEVRKFINSMKIGGRDWHSHKGTGAVLLLRHNTTRGLKEAFDSWNGQEFKVFVVIFVMFPHNRIT